MERKQWILTIVGIIVICVAIFAVFYIMFMSLDVVINHCYATVSLQDPVSLGENVWMVEIENVNTPEGCSDLEFFRIRLEQGESVIIADHQLQNGLTAQAEEILIFFTDQGSVGSFDSGDQFYLVNLEIGSEYKFYVRGGTGPVVNVAVYT
jgi:hypothetical protein